MKIKNRMPNVMAFEKEEIRSEVKREEVDMAASPFIRNFEVKSIG
jgi:hypothetical protein